MRDSKVLGSGGLFSRTGYPRSDNFRMHRHSTATAFSIANPSPLRFTDDSFMKSICPSLFPRPLCGWMTLGWLLASFGNSVEAAQVKLGEHTFTLPDDFEISRVTTTNLVERPIAADFDDQGRLYVADSSGSNEAVEKQLQDKPHRIVRLEDTDGDGTYDRSVVFADHMMFPEGVMWSDGSLYVGAPPSIWKLTDTNEDGVADQRAEWFQGKTLTRCANDLHGPYLGPDGWIYWAIDYFEFRQLLLLYILLPSHADLHPLFLSLYPLLLKILYIKYLYHCG